MRMPEDITLTAKIETSGICYQMAEVLADISLEFHEASQRMEALGEKYVTEEVGEDVDIDMGEEDAT